MRRKVGRPCSDEQIKDCRISLVVTQEMYDQLREECWNNRVTMNQYITDLIAKRKSFVAECNAAISLCESDIKLLNCVQSDIRHIATMLGVQVMRFPNVFENSDSRKPYVENSTK